jgi:hypothetical protein
MSSIKAKIVLARVHISPFHARGGKIIQDHKNLIPKGRFDIAIPAAVIAEGYSLSRL